MKGTNYNNERRTYYDKKSGAYVIQLTTFPTINEKLYMHVDQFTPDSKTIVFRSHRKPERGAPIDLFRCDVNGSNLIQLTNRPDVTGACLDSTGKWVYFVGNGGVLTRVSMDDYHEEELAAFPAMNGAGCSSVTADGKHYFCDSFVNDAGPSAVRFDIDKGTAEVIYSAKHVSHVQHDPSDAGWVGIQCDSIAVVRYDGTEFKHNAINNSNGHWGWLAKTGMLFTNRADDHNRMSIANHITGKNRDVVISDHFFWHGGCSYDGKWLVSDTNWPNEGVFIINIESGECACIADSKHYGAHPQFTHGHPSFSPDGNSVAFNSNEMGCTHVCIAQIPPELKTKLERK